ncbi:hypothetical protein [Halolamina rubra]|uniref:hypothetical protein n=1 Tax=Halolamina rubra TaxID=1380430 RepID=UPI000679D58A|nr:hypothetical protein [Halolamina rubra]
MAKTVDELRNEIRVATGRFEREISAAFTKEDLAALCDAVGYEIGGDSLPPKPEMRAGILEMIGDPVNGATDGIDRSFRKGELEAIAAALEA